MIVISVVLNGQPQIELAAVRQLIQIEIEKCRACQQVYDEHQALPLHCHNCFTLRDERWYLKIRERADALLRKGIFR